MSNTSRRNTARPSSVTTPAGRTPASGSIRDAKRRAALARRTQTGTSVRCAGSGYLDKHKGTSPESVRELTGLATQFVTNEKSTVVPTELGKKLGLIDAWQDNLQPDCFFTVTDAKPEETLAVYSGGPPAFVMRKTPAGGTSIFVGVPRLDPQLLRLAAAQAGGSHLHETVRQRGCKQIPDRAARFAG